MPLLASLRERARALKRDLNAIAAALTDPRTPASARAVAVLTLAYAASPIDLIPDFIPILGYLDDLILLPAGIALTIKLIPPEVLDDARTRAQAGRVTRGGKAAAAVIALVWLALLVLAARWAWRAWGR
ncbi:MAG TPA: DUF1232 domain-containing protein [Deinococcales bacterium]|nr:DUF1232 domain-containing protein [Deinococcales bacterium]